MQHSSGDPRVSSLLDACACALWHDLAAGKLSANPVAAPLPPGQRPAASVQLPGQRPLSRHDILSLMQAAPNLPSASPDMHALVR